MQQSKLAAFAVLMMCVASARGAASKATLDQELDERTKTWRYLDATGTPRQFKLVLRDIRPSVAVAVVESGTDGFIYTYELANASTARDPLFFCSGKVAEEFVVEAPADWERVSFALNGRFGWFQLKAPHGIQPGRFQAGFVLRSRNLPGIIELWCHGESEPLVLPDLPEHVHNEVFALRQTREFRGPAIGPVIAIGDHPEPSVIAQRIVQNYRQAIEQVGGGGTDLLLTLDSLGAAAQDGDPANIGTAANRVSVVLAITPGRDEWRAGLTICLRELRKRLGH